MEGIIEPRGWSGRDATSTIGALDLRTNSRPKTGLRWRTWEAKLVGKAEKDRRTVKKNPKTYLVWKFVAPTRERQPS